jgi:trk system potassium uptake protein
MSSWSIRTYVSPVQIILLAICTTVGVGVLLLALPQASPYPIPLIDLIFTATSVVCVAGLSTVPFTVFTTFGKVVLLSLIQIGGLGLVTITLFFMYLLLNIGLAGNVTASRLLEIESWREMHRIIVFIIVFTLFCELIGAICIYNIVASTNPGNTGLFFALFHAIASFCNAGIVLSPNIIAYHGSSPSLLLLTMILMFSGGLGFFTWYELCKWGTAWWNQERHKLSLHSTLTLQVSAILIIGTTFMYLLLEHHRSLLGISFPYALLIALFHAVSFRSAGFAAVPLITLLHPATILLLFVIAIIGSGSGSTGSGIRVTTLAVFIATVRTAITGRDHVEIASRTIPYDQVYKAIAIIALSCSWILLCTFILLITEPLWSFGDLLFESASAFTGVGISTGVTPALSYIGKITIIITMIAGRIGSLTVLLSLMTRKPSTTTEFSYPQERVLLGQ